MMLFLSDAPLAQLDRALDYESSGQRFESSRARHLSQGLSHNRLAPFFVMYIFLYSWLASIYGCIQYRQGISGVRRGKVRIAQGHGKGLVA